MDLVIAGKANLDGFRTEAKLVDTACSQVNPIPTGLEDRNRTAPFPFCGNRFEVSRFFFTVAPPAAHPPPPQFRACGGAQNTSFPVAMLNTAFADGMKVLNDKVRFTSSLFSSFFAPLLPQLTPRPPPRSRAA